MPKRDKQPRQTRKDVPPGVSPISGVAPPEEYKWKKGRSGNPGGYSKKRRLQAALDRHIAGMSEEELSDLMDGLFAKIQAGDRGLLEYLWDRAEGKMANKVEIEDAGTKKVALTEEEVRRAMEGDDAE